MPQIAKTGKDAPICGAVFAIYWNKIIPKIQIIALGKFICLLMLCPNEAPIITANNGMKTDDNVIRKVSNSCIGKNAAAKPANATKILPPNFSLMIGFN